MSLLFLGDYFLSYFPTPLTSYLPYFATYCLYPLRGLGSDSLIHLLSWMPDQEEVNHYVDSQLVQANHYHLKAAEELEVQEIGFATDVQMKYRLAADT